MIVRRLYFWTNQFIMAFEINLKDQRPEGSPTPLIKPAAIVYPTLVPKQILITSGGACGYDEVLQKLWTGADGIDVANAKASDLGDYRVVQAHICNAGAANLYVAWAIAQSWAQQPSSGNPDQNWPQSSID